MYCPVCGEEIKTKIKYMGHYAPLKGERFDYRCECRLKFVIYVH